jgi:hypothetical protein
MDSCCLHLNCVKIDRNFIKNKKLELSSLVATNPPSRNIWRCNGNYYDFFFKLEKKKSGKKIMNNNLLNMELILRLINSSFFLCGVFVMVYVYDCKDPFKLWQKLLALKNTGLFLFLLFHIESL